MDYLRVTYICLEKNTSGELLLDLRSQRWTARKVAHAIIRHEFPLTAGEPMNGDGWSADRALGKFGIGEVKYTYLHAEDARGV